ncbi:MAG: response regulator transcription factor [Balneola sp.]
MSIQIAIVEDQQKIIERLRQRLSFFNDIEILFTACNAKKALENLEKLTHLPKVILMDIEMPGKSGIELTGIVKEKYPEIDILIQTVFENDDKIFQSIQAGASGYLLKDDPIQKYVDAIQELNDGKAALSPLIAAKLMSFVKDVRRSRSEKVKVVQEEFSLSDRELDILKGIVEDLTEHQIGEELFISHHTVRTHIKNIYKKIHVHSRASAVRFALSNGLV